MRMVVAIALAAAVLGLSAASSTAGATHGSPHHALGFNCISSCSAYASTINQFFTDVSADSGQTTNVYSVLPDYANIQYSSTFGGPFVDGNPYPTSKCHDDVDTYCLTDKQLSTEIASVIAANGWPTQSPTTLYFIFTPANVGICQHGGNASDGIACTTNVFCAYHNATDSFIYAVEPDDAAVSQGACDSGEAPAGNSADATLSTVSHEAVEAITDPYGNGWYSEDPETFDGLPNAFFGSEIGDLCAWNFGASLGTTLSGQAYNQVINGHDYFLQQEWSNTDGGCVQNAGGTVTNFDSSNPFYAGVGPLVYHGGAVMATTTVYAIYWIPAAPANHKLPTIAGIRQVGRKLRAFHGTWSYEPTLTYRWLRCSPAGTSCTIVKRAFAATYTVRPTDAGHRLELRITATNQGGRTRAISVPTGKVRS